MNKKRVVIVLLWVCVYAVDSFSQSAPGKYWIQFKDKSNNPYSIYNPSEFLSQRSLQRRINQNIQITTDDLPVTPQYLDSLQRLGLVILNKSKWFNAVTVQSDDTALLDTITKLSFVKTIQMFTLNKERPLKEEAGQNGINSFSNSCNIFNYGASSNQIEMLKGQVLHNFGFQGQGKIIAVLDAGFYKVDVLPAFDSLRMNQQIISTRDFVNGGNMVYDQASHGMMVLSTIGGYIPGKLIGTAPGASFLLLRTEDAGSEYLIEEDNWVSGAEYADSSGADIITSSLGYTTFNNSLQNYYYSSMNGRTSRSSIAATLAARKGMIVVNSAGNSGANWWHYIGAPADADSILSVGAVDSVNAYVNFSSTGPTFDGRVKPDVVARGSLAAIQGVDGNVGYGSGTSFSAPIIAGMVACLWGANPLANNMEIIDAIKKSSDQYSHPDSLKGFGLPDFSYANSILHGIDHNDFSVENLLNVYPNPFSDYFDIRFYSVEIQNIKISIFNILGDKIFENHYHCFPYTVNYFRINGLSPLNSRGLHSPD